MKKLFASLIAILALLTACAYAETDGFSFAQTDEGLCLAGYTGSETLLYLPAEHEGEPVVAIAEGAFRNNATIVEVFVPDNYQVIGTSAFEGCVALKDVYLGKDVAEIGSRAFADCPALLSVSITSFDFVEAEDAYSGSYAGGYNGANMAELWGTTSGEKYDLLYIAACDMMSRGEFEQARDAFLAIYGYELSSDNYFYCAARAYERRGDIDAALAIYALMPDHNDCQARLAYYGGVKEVETFFFDNELYTELYDAYFGEDSPYAAYAATDAGDEIIGGADEPTSMVVGGGLADGEQPTAAPETDVPEATEAPKPTMEPDPALMSYNEYSGDMPYEFRDFSNSDGYYAMYYYYDDVATIEAYIALFGSRGWTTFVEEMDGWTHIYVSAPNQASYFYVSYNETDKMLALMYEAGMEFSFDPREGL